MDLGISLSKRGGSVKSGGDRFGFDSLPGFGIAIEDDRSNILPSPVRIPIFDTMT